MKTMEDLNKYGLDSLELKALSVPSSLRFLLGIEYDVVLCVNEVGPRRPFRLHFPVFATTFRKLLSLCATRFKLECEHGESESVLTGTAYMPLLRYADFLPGALHMNEILECLQVQPAAKARKWVGDGAASTGTSASPTPDAGDAGGAAVVATASNEFAAGFIDYSEFSSDSSLDDVHGLGFYLLLDYGLGLATHSHLVGIRFHKDWDATEALREFQEFSGWSAFDLRFHDEQRRHDGGVIVMPSSQDASDLLERYEDEDSDDEGDLLPFILRPVSPLVSVPSLEDAALRKLRDQHWGEVEKHWAHLPCTPNTVVVYNLYDGATLSEVLAFFEPLPIVSSSFVEDNAPSHRRRAFITFESLEATRKALDVDGKNTRGCTLRVQVSPPYISVTRRGNLVTAERDSHGVGCGTPKPTTGAAIGGRPNQKTASPAASPSLRMSDGSAAAPQLRGKGAVNGSGATASAAPVPGACVGGIAAALGHAVPTSAAAAGVAASSLPPDRARQIPSGPAPPYVAPAGPPPPAASVAIPRAAHFSGVVDRTTAVSAAMATRPLGPAVVTTAPPLPPTRGGGALAAAIADKDRRAGVMSSPGGSHMNASAKEFVPHFQLSANSPEYRPAPPPKMDAMYSEYGGPMGVHDGFALPPPPPPPPPPPSYADALNPLPEYRPAPRSAHLSHMAPSPSLPPYALPPPYGAGGEGREDMFPPSMLPPPYSSD
ncbi:RNA-binding protein [Novymonas esmeraldas]|uniref:RNA-binding protein n=1 Tax=Novymonas esmeraldas TaxID=1808958 RepID=A0AAW0F8H9_9TRYP